MSDDRVTTEIKDEKLERRLTLIEQGIDAERMKEIDLSGKAPGDLFGVKFESMLQVMDFSKLMAVSGSAIPPHLRGYPGTCLAIIIRALELKMSPFTVANWSYEVEQKGVKRIAYESAFYNAVILSRAPTKDRPHFEIIGEGEERRCKVWATFKGETEPRIFITDTLAKLRPPRNEQGVTKGSPLWDKKADVQLIYNAIRDFARIYFPDVTAGLYTKDELEDEEPETGLGERARVISPDTPLLQRLTPMATGEGFDHTTKDKMAQAINAARGIKTTAPDSIKDTEVKKSGGATTVDETATEAKPPPPKDSQS